MRGYNKQFGELGENTAVKYLENKGYTIIETNYSTRYGELDIICKKDGILIIAEVKTRSQARFGAAAEAVTKSKINKIKRTTEEYIIQNNIDCPIRFDVIEVYARKYNDEILIEEINHIEDAFWV